MVFGLCSVWPGVQLCNLDMVFSECTKISYKAPWGCGVCSIQRASWLSRSTRGYSLLFLLLQPALACSRKCFRSEWLLGCRVFLSVPNSWCWRLNGAAWEEGVKGSRKPICCAEKGLFFQKILILQCGELVWTVAGLLVMPKVSDS